MTRKSGAKPQEAGAAQTPPIEPGGVFISHVHEDEALAESFALLIENVSAGVVPTYRSTAKQFGKGIQYGEEWFRWIRESVEKARHIVALLTPTSTGRPWILFEAGLGKADPDSVVFGVALGISREDAYKGPFAVFQNCGTDDKELAKLCKELMAGTAAKPCDEMVAKCVQEFQAKVVAHFGRQEPGKERGERLASVVVHENEGVIGEAVWDGFYEQARSRIDLMGHSMSKILQKRADPELEGEGASEVAQEEKPSLLEQAVRNGCSVRLLLLNPEGRQVREIGLRLKHGTELEDKIRASLSAADTVRAETTSGGDPSVNAGNMGSILVRVTDQTMYRKLSRFDDMMVVTSYASVEEPGDKCPAVQVWMHQDRHLFNFHCHEFKRMWDRGLDWLNDRVLRRVPDVNEIRQHYEAAESLWRLAHPEDYPQPENWLPRMAVVYPTYNCTLGCGYCSFSDCRARQGDEMSARLFHVILRDLAQNEIPTLEISGGGEPLDNGEIEPILREVDEFHHEHRPKFGLLTNGLGLSRPGICELVARNFEYVRMSYSDKVLASEGDNSKFLRNLSRLAGMRRDNPTEGGPRVGVKILLTRHLLENDAARALEMMHTVLSLGIDHLKIRLVRSKGSFVPKPAQVEAIKPKLVDLADNHPEVEVRFDLYGTEAERNFRCWIGPLVMVIDPEGGAYPCLNYHSLRNRQPLGTYPRDNLDSFWKPNKLSRFRKEAAPKACNSKTSCDCRLLTYQGVMEELITCHEWVKEPEDAEQERHRQGLIMARNGFVV